MSSPDSLYHDSVEVCLAVLAWPSPIVVPTPIPHFAGRKLNELALFYTCNVCFIDIALQDHFLYNLLTDLYDFRIGTFISFHGLYKHAPCIHASARYSLYCT